jgi:hypothetical protein
MNALVLDNLPDRTIKDLMDRFGAAATLRAVAAALLARARASAGQPRAADLSDHIRADIGLPPRHPDPRSGWMALSGRLY